MTCGVSRSWFVVGQALQPASPSPPCPTRPDERLSNPTCLSAEPLTGHYASICCVVTSKSSKTLRDSRQAGSPASGDTVLTKSTYERLSTELEQLTTVGRVEIARQIEAARALGDLSENGDYHAAKDAQGKMESRIRQLQAMLQDPTVVPDEEAAASTTVTVGSVVTVKYDDDDEMQSLVVGTIEERREGMSVVSPQSPMGQALIGKSAGDTIEYEAPGGTLKVTIVSLGE